jgi:hypothetical protein
MTCPIKILVFLMESSSLLACSSTPPANMPQGLISDMFALPRRFMTQEQTHAATWYVHGIEKPDVEV